MTDQSVTSVEGAEETLAPLEAEHLVSLARACRAALHAVTLYPDDHPAVGRAISRLEAAGQEITRGGPFPISVLPSDLQVRGRGLARPETAVYELAGLLHVHLIGALTVHPGVEGGDWRRFLVLVTASPDDIRDQGGMARAWTTSGGQHLEIREIDYAELLDERSGGAEASWALIIEHCLRGDAVDLEDDVLRALVDIAADATRLGDFVRQLEQRAEGGGGSHAMALLKLLALTLDVCSAEGEHTKAERVLANMATVVSEFSPENMLAWLAAARERSTGSAARAQASGGPRVPPAESNPAAAVVSRIGEAEIARFVAGAVASGGVPTTRLTQAFQALVPDPARRTHVLDLARLEAVASPFGHSADFDRLWTQLESLLASYDDSAFVAADYAAELDGSQGWSETVARIADDPPERLADWLATVSDAAVRRLDVQLLLDLLAIETDPERWSQVADSVATELEDLILLGDFEPAARLLEAVLNRPAGPASSAVAASRAAVVERLLAGQTLVHTAYHLQTASDEEFEAIKRVCRTLGEPAVKPLADMLVVEQQGRVRQRLTEVLIAFGSLGRQSVEQLKQSQNPSVRRTAIHLLREFGGSEALPDLEALLDDTEPHVQREAVRAILTIATDEAFAVLQRALTSGSDRTRAAIFHQVHSAADERLAPLFCYILEHTGRRGPLALVALQAIDALGDIGGDEAVAALDEALRRGEWWAPRRTGVFRAAAARALRATGSERALALLQGAAESGTYGVRRAARAALAEAAPARARSH